MAEFDECDISSFMERWANKGSRSVIGQQKLDGSKVYLLDRLDRDYAPIEASVPAGQYGISIYQKMWTWHPAQPETLVHTFMSLDITDENVARWEFLEMEPHPVRNYGLFICEFGFLAFMNDSHRKRIKELDDQHDNIWDDFLEKFEMDGNDMRIFAEVDLGDDMKFFEVAPPSGNGMYPAFVGFSESGAPARIAVDFLVRRRN